MSDGIRYIDIREFREAGYLQEVNRRFLHPLGLALEVVRDDDGTERLGGVRDSRDDPEGIAFFPLASFDAELHMKATAIDDEWGRRMPQRVAGLGFMVQPTDYDQTGD